MVGCTASGCRSHSTKKEHGITFHRFPKDPQKRKSWIYNMKLTDWEPTKHDRICSRHFEKRFLYGTEQKVCLLNQAVPTIFPELVYSMNTDDIATKEDYINYIYSTKTKPNTSTATCSSSHNGSSPLRMDPPTSTSRNCTSATTSSSLKRDTSEAILEDAVPNLENKANFCDLFGKMISLKFRKISAEQRLFAEKIINEVLFDAQMGKLTMDHRLTNSPVWKNDSDMFDPSVYHCRDLEQHQSIHGLPFKVEEDFTEDFDSHGE